MKTSYNFFLEFLGHFQFRSMETLCSEMIIYLLVSRFKLNRLSLHINFISLNSVVGQSKKTHNTRRHLTVGFIPGL